MKRINDLRQMAHRICLGRICLGLIGGLVATSAAAQMRPFLGEVEIRVNLPETWDESQMFIPMNIEIDTFVSRHEHDALLKSEGLSRALEAQKQSLKALGRIREGWTSGMHLSSYGVEVGVWPEGQAMEAENLDPALDSFKEVAATLASAAERFRQNPKQIEASFHEPFVYIFGADRKSFFQLWACVGLGYLVQAEKLEIPAYMQRRLENLCSQGAPVLLTYLEDQSPKPLPTDSKDLALFLYQTKEILSLNVAATDLCGIQLEEATVGFAYAQDLKRLGWLPADLKLPEDRPSDFFADSRLNEACNFAMYERVMARLPQVYAAIVKDPLSAVGHNRVLDRMIQNSLKLQESGQRTREEIIAETAKRLLESASFGDGFSQAPFEPDYLNIAGFWEAHQSGIDDINLLAVLLSPVDSSAESTFFKEAALKSSEERQGYTQRLLAVLLEDCSETVGYDCLEEGIERLKYDDRLKIHFKFGDETVGLLHFLAK